MPNRTAVNLKVLIFAILAPFSGLAACGGGNSSVGVAAGSTSPTMTSTTVSTYATPQIITSGSSAVVTWSSASNTSCSSSNGLGGTGASGSFSTGNLTKNTTYTITCVGPNGTQSQSTMVAVANTPTLNKILSTENTWAATPVRGTPHYYCDCGTGASSSCVAGNDANAGTSMSAPRKTIAAAITQLNSLTGTNTVALCKGGAFNENPTGEIPFYGLYINNNSCAAGTTCNDLREYASTVFTSSAKPIINAPANSSRLNLFTIHNGAGGIRFLNIRLQGDGSTYNGIFMYNGVHDMTLGNLTVDDFQIGLYDEPDQSPTVVSNNVIMTGNTITNSSAQGYLGAGNSEQLSYNYFDGNGGNTGRDHTIYLSSHQPVANMSVTGNYIHGQFGAVCIGVVMTAHGQFNYLSMSNNVIDVDPSASDGGCYGINIGSGLYPIPVYFRHTTISGNTITNGGNYGIGVATCSDCLISDNALIFNAGNTPAIQSRPTGIVAAYEATRISPADDLNTRTTIINNTIWAAPNSISGLLGVQVRIEGSGYIVANNTVNYDSSNAGTWGGVQCFDYSSLPLSSYAFINNNQCNSASTGYTWELTSGKSLTAWRSFSAGGLAGGMSADELGKSFVGAPNFKSTTSPYNFQPNTGSPLLGAGSPTYAPTNGTDITGANWLSSPAIGAYE